MSRAIAIITAALWVSLFGCGAAMRPSRYYQLETPRATPASATHPVTLIIGHLSGPHLYHDDRLVYRNGALELGTYQYHRWIEPPTDMLQGMLFRMLRDSGRYRSVQLQRSNLRGDFILRGHLHQLEEISTSHPVARVAFDIELFDLKTGSIVWSKPYSQDERANGKDVPSVVEALNRNVQRGLEEVLSGLDEYFALHPSR